MLQLLNVYAAKYETGGKFWPIVHSSTIFSLILMHIIAIGLFGLKELPLASSLTTPLPILTLLFSIYCQRRFLPNFKSYPTEVNALEMLLKIICSFLRTVCENYILNQIHHLIGYKQNIKSIVLRISPGSRTLCSLCLCCL